MVVIASVLEKDVFSLKVGSMLALEIVNNMSIPNTEANATKMINIFFYVRCLLCYQVLPLSERLPLQLSLQPLNYTKETAYPLAIFFMTQWRSPSLNNCQKGLLVQFITWKQYFSYLLSYCRKHYTFHILLSQLYVIVTKQPLPFLTSQFHNSHNSNFALHVLVCTSYMENHFSSQ